MARRKRHHKNRRHKRSALRLGNPRRHHKNRRKSRKMFRLFNRRRHRNPALGELAMALLAGAGGYVGSKLIGNFAEKYLPASVPQREIVGTGLSALAAAWVAETALANRPKVAAAVAVGAMIPLAEEVLRMTPVGPMIGLFERAPGSPMAGPAAEALPAPGGIEASLAERLAANLNDRYQMYASSY